MNNLKNKEKRVKINNNGLINKCMTRTHVYEAKADPTDDRPQIKV